MGNSSSSAVARERFGELVQRGVFRPVERHLHVEREDRMAEGIGLTWEQYSEKSDAGVWLDPALVVHICKLRATDFSRFVVRGEQRRRDALDPRHYFKGEGEVVRLDGLLDEETGTFSGEGDLALELGLAERVCINPEENIHSAHDLLRWLRGLDAEDVDLLVLRLAGFGLEECAEAMGTSTSTVFKRLRDLGHELADRAGLAVIKKARKPRTPKLAPGLDS